MRTEGGTMSEFDVVVVGAGQAGLGIGYELQQSGLDFVILERGAIGETWRSQRWESFAVNTPNWMNHLPGQRDDDEVDPDGFYLRDDLVASFERYAATHALPIRLGVTVEQVEAAGEDGGFVIETVDQAGAREAIRARNIVVASGMMRAPKIPAIRERFPDRISQLHSSDYRSAATLPEGAVVVIGSGQSGCQIAEDLAAAGRAVYLCTSKVARVPRRYRGRDALAWMEDLGMWDERSEDLPDPQMRYAPQPQVSGVGRRGRTVSLQALQLQGIALMGHLSDVAEGVLTTDHGLAEHIAFADEFSAEFKAHIDAYIEENGLDVQAADHDPIDAAAGPEVAGRGMTTLDLGDASVSTVIWCTGFTTSLDWLRVPVLDEDGHPLHDRGVSPVPGIYFLGFPWLHTRKSGIIYGIDEDAAHVAEAITSTVA
jgi:putative flavoprotein involved in K+ transport